MKVLVSSAGRRVQLIGCFRKAAAELGLPLTVLAVDANSAMSAACEVADESFTVSRCSAPSFIPEMLCLCDSEQIKLLIPTIDTELEVLAAHRQDFAAIGTTLSISSPEVIAICRDKIQTSRFLNELGILTPRTSTVEEVLQDSGSWEFPVVSKPISGSSSVGLAVVNTLAELAAQRTNDQIVQELWRGAEYTVNMFFDREKLICVVPHRRLEVRGGEVNKARTERIPILLEYARKIGAPWEGKAFGALCFQAIVTDRGEAAVFEINGRFGGGYPLAHQAGAPFAKWLLEIVLNYPSSGSDIWQESLTMLRYDSAIFIPPSRQS